MKPRPPLTAAMLRAAVQRLIDRGTLANPQSIQPGEQVLVLDLDDHVSDESIAGGRLRIALRSKRELWALAAAVDEEVP